MTKRQMLTVGFALYLLSFFLIAVVGNGPARGYMCAYLATGLALDTSLIQPGQALAQKRFEYVALVITASTNFLFLLGAILAVKTTRRWRTPAVVVRALLLMTIPFSWVLMAYESGYPREGYFLWIIGMLLVLFADHATGSPQVSS